MLKEEKHGRASGDLEDCPRGRWAEDIVTARMGRQCHSCVLGCDSLYTVIATRKRATVRTARPAVQMASKEPQTVITVIDNFK